MTLELNGQQVLVILVSLAIITFAAINIYKKFSHSWSIARQSHHSFGFGLILSICFAIVAMSWTIYDMHSFDENWILDQVEIPVEIIVPRTPPPLPPPPPPAPIAIEEVLEEEVIDDHDLVDSSIDQDTEIIEEYVPVEKIIPTLPPPPPLPEPDDSDIEEIRNFSEIMPLFGGCADKACSDAALLAFIYNHIKYPAIARENGVAGRVTAEFVVEKNGNVSAVKILRGIGAGCDQEVLKLIELMNNLNEPQWTPGRQGGRSVRVLYRLPVTFKLSN